jgi:hypothetical protein
LLRLFSCISQGEAAAAAGLGLNTPPTAVKPADQPEVATTRPSSNPKIIVGKVEVGPATRVLDGEVVDEHDSGNSDVTNETINSGLNSTAHQPNKDDFVDAQNLSMNITTFMNYKEKVAAFADALETALNKVPVPSFYLMLIFLRLLLQQTVQSFKKVLKRLKR